MIITDSIISTPHAIIAGTTGSGKSVLIHGIINRIITSDSPARLFLVDPKRVELREYGELGIVRNYANNSTAAKFTVQKLVVIMGQRFAEMERQWLKKSPAEPCYLIVDEMADLLAESPEIEEGIVKLMRLGRAANIHCILATQSPNRSKGGGLSAALCQNCTLAVALRCRSAIESRQIIGASGAERLPQHGEALVLTPEGIKRFVVDNVTDDDTAAAIRTARMRELQVLVSAV